MYAFNGIGSSKRLWHENRMEAINLNLMFQNYFKIAFRFLIRNKAFTIINIFGLVLGISFSTMLYTYVHHELSYDTYHEEADNLYRVLTRDRSDPGRVRTYGITVPAVGSELVSSFPEVRETVRLHQFSGQVIIETEKAQFNERNYFITSDTNFFHVFKFDFVEGNPETSLSQPMSVILTASTAKRYFGDEEAINKTLRLNNAGEVNVTAVIRDPPSNSHLRFDLLLTGIGSPLEWKKYLESWTEYNAYTYFVLQEGNSIDHLQEQMPVFVKEHLGEDAADVDIAFQPVTDIYLHSSGIEVGSEAEHGQLYYVYIFSTMALFLLIVAAINYINLTTSQASTRAKEIGIRKVTGAYRSQLVFQFLSETLLVSIISMVFALVVMELCFPYFNSITGKHFDLNASTLKDFIPSLLGVTIVIGLIAGSYPAFYLAQMRPVSSIKGQIVFGKKKLNLRTVLVVSQFVITIVLITSTLVIDDQLNFIQTKNIGFNKDQLMIIDINSQNVREQFRAVKNEYAKIIGVQQVSVSSRVPGEWKNIKKVYVKSKSEKDPISADSLQTYFMGFDEDMMKTYQLKMTAGNYFTGAAADSMNVVINASAAEALNLKKTIGAVIRIATENGEWSATVIGIMEDFNFQSLHQKVAPIVIGYRNNPLQSIDYFTLKISGSPTKAIAAAANVHQKFDTQTPMEYHFLSDQLNTFYVAEEKAQKIFKMGGVLSVLLACLGLLGLASYHVKRRMKELSIRKILGADAQNLFFMVSFSFTKQVFLAFVFACPLTWYLMREWLQGFEFRTVLDPGIFIMAGITVLLLALITVSYHSIRAARFNPVDSLKND